MDPVLVPGPPKTAFNKGRCMSDLIKKQVDHFKHLEHKLPPEIRATLPQHAIVTEDDAARYIAPMTRFLLSRKAAPASAKVLVMPSREELLDLAASAEAVPATETTPPTDAESGSRAAPKSRRAGKKKK